MASRNEADTCRRFILRKLDAGGRDGHRPASGAGRSPHRRTSPPRRVFSSGDAARSPVGARRPSRTPSRGNPSPSETYQHPTAESLLRPDVGTEAQFRKKQQPRTSRYDTFLSPERNCDGQNPARAGDAPDPGRERQRSVPNGGSAPDGFWFSSTGTVDADHGDGKDLHCWLLDTHHNALCFHVCQAFFPRTAAWDNLKRSLVGQCDDSVWDHLAGTIRTPLQMGEHKQLAPRVIDDRGNELMIVKESIRRMEGSK
jgi:hypothetical protein